jgi:hypothetical protein
VKKLSVTTAQLWIGEDTTLLQNVQNYLHTIFCPKQGCGNCPIYLQINHQQHHACLWFSPEGNTYTLDLIKPFFSTIARSLNDHEKFFFIFQHADFFSSACSNSLLKSIEEPPPGYHMIFLAQNLHNVSPTLRSRCIISQITTDAALSKPYDLLPFFIEQSSDFEQFVLTLDRSLLDDRTTQEMLEQIISYWSQEYKKYLLTNHVTNHATDHEQRILNIIKIVRDSFEKLPMPGSAKIFWKNLFLKMQ